MQTFLPEGKYFYDGFERLDDKRLGKQRVEAWQVLNVLLKIDNDGKPRQSNGWANHPAVRMWRGHEFALATYGLVCCRVWLERGFNDTMLQRFRGRRDQLQNQDQRLPMWLRTTESHQSIMVSHRSNLIRKKPDHYSQFWPTLRDDLPYYWPVS